MGSVSEENSLCFLCYKPTSCVNPDQNRNCPENFVPLLFRHLNIINTRSQNLVNEFQCCDDCSVLSKSFCDFFLQLESIQLQLTWKVRRIYETMFDAATDPTRFNKFRQSFFGVEDDDELEGGRRQLFNDIQKTRNNLMKKCKEVWKSKEPRVQLERIFKEEDIPNQTEVEVKREILSPEEMRMISPVEATVLNHCPQLATFFSYLVVLHLSLPIDTLSSPHSHFQIEELLEPKIELMELRKKKRTINDIPSKLLDRLLSYLNDPKDLFNCRLVQNSWKDSMSRVLEEKVLSISSKWNLLEFNASEPLIPNLWLDLREGYTLQQQIFCPPSFMLHQDNPFPSKSLQFGTTSQKGKSLFLQGREIGNVNQLFAKFGHYLSCLVIDGFSTYPTKFAQLLSQVPHLKTLTLAGLHLKIPEGEAFDGTTCLLPPLPQLTHLCLSECGTSITSVLEIHFILWILERYSDQLEGLAVFDEILSYEDEQKFMLEDLKMNKKLWKLKQLKISTINKFILQMIRAPALTHIMVTPVNCDHLVKMEELLGFISNFSKSLEYLRIKVLVTNFEKKRKSKAKFTALKKLSILFPKNENEVNIMKTHILPRFTVLEKLEFLCRGNFKPEIGSAIEKAEYWKVCPLLQEISADCDGVDFFANRKYDCTNQVVWRTATGSS
ncbi:unnamed protein product [Orchesella dallaii]|uniref:F-box domain-containing protein n=1 Tax=Orchesella dallaii TaxID=48710 RepID=A0ABP1R2D9_9HEXA